MRLVTRRRLKWALVLVLAAAIIGYALWQVGRARCFQLVGEITCRVQTSQKLVALSFDDGPTPQGVAALLPVLREHGARATFFLIGQEMERHPGLARRLAAAGHEIANHSYAHDRMLGLFPGAYAEELERTNRLLRAEGVNGLLLFRPPYGKKLTGLPIAVERAGLRMITWDVEDPPGSVSDPAAYADHIMRGVRPGSIILMHPMYASGRTAREALPLILTRLRAAGYRVVTVRELLEVEAREEAG
ncbi:polysaccharide deacetylase [Sphingomonas gilva]|uniref:Chitooligosaccharide deacetylase n=1 Tax=Sphingomonas gilva TaxID=2305907 RepID=A0A396RLB7_9SPHN|nr:polysaccharide deacetylase family protein [Sphingomonas gilva]RHW17117.1 polysaccharide deacetylase [Sphingomonas gilva]